MLNKRLITALILIALLLLAIWFLPSIEFAIFTGLIVVMAAWEWTILIPLRSLWGRLLYAACVLSSLVLVYYCSTLWILGATLLAWVWAFLALIVYERRNPPVGFQYAWIKAGFGVLVLMSSWLCINVLREDIGGPAWLLFGLLLIMSTDTGAFFVGKRFGKKRFWFSRVSPNKTNEGLWAGMLIPVAVAAILCTVTKTPLLRSIDICLLAWGTASFSLLGDLFESLLKREAGVKDSGTLLPGHGGILDRIDSGLAALPLFTLGSLFLGS